MRCPLLLVVLAGLFALQPVLAQNKARQVFSIPAARMVSSVAAAPAPEAPAEVITLSNFDLQSSQIVWFWNSAAPDSGFVLGTNFFEDQAKATVFSLPNGVTEALVTEVNVWFAYKREGLTNQTYALEILEGTAATGPGDIPLYSESFMLAGVDADTDAQTPSNPTNHVLQQPVQVGSTFFISVDFGSYGETEWGNTALVATDLLGTGVPEVWEKWSDGSWNNVSAAWFQNADDGWHLWIEAVIDTDLTTAVEGIEEIPDAVFLAPNYPNPFNPATVLNVSLPGRMEVDLRVVDALGRTVAILVQGTMEAGLHPVRFEAVDLPSGVYLAYLRAGSITQTQKLVLLR